jgi:hypothetical protein
MASLCPVFQEPQLTDNNEFLSGGLLWFYEAGTSTLAIAYSDSNGTVPWANPIVLDSRGECAGTIWLNTGEPYRIVLENKPIYGQTHGVVITEHDNITGITSSDAPEDWVAFGAAPTFISTTSFTVAGDYRSIFIANRKLRITDSGGVSVHSVISSSFALNVTTVNVTGLIDSGLSLVEYSFVTPASSPDRFEDVVITDDLTVGDDAVIDGNLTVSGNTVLSGNLNSQAATNLLFGAYVGASSGSLQLTNNLLLQWGSATTDSGTKYVDVTLPIAYTDPQWGIYATTSYSGPTGVTATVSRTSNSVFRISTYSGATPVGPNTVYWLVLGKKV